MREFTAAPITLSLGGSVWVDRETDDRLVATVDKGHLYRGQMVWERSPVGWNVSTPLGFLPTLAMRDIADRDVGTWARVLVRKFEPLFALSAEYDRRMRAGAAWFVEWVQDNVPPSPAEAPGEDGSSAA